MHMLFKSGLLSQTDWENMALTFSKCSKMVKFWTLNGIIRSLLQATELEQSSQETLDYMAYLIWIRVLISQIENLRFGTLPKIPHSRY